MLSQGSCFLNDDNLYPLYQYNLSKLRPNTLKDAPICARKVIYGDGAGNLKDINNENLLLLE